MTACLPVKRHRAIQPNGVTASDIFHRVNEMLAAKKSAAKPAEPKQKKPVVKPLPMDIQHDVHIVSEPASDLNNLLLKVNEFGKEVDGLVKDLKAENEQLKKVNAELLDRCVQLGKDLETVSLPDQVVRALLSLEGRQEKLTRQEPWEGL
jgi:hypothetical protein